MATAAFKDGVLSPVSEGTLTISQGLSATESKDYTIDVPPGATLQSVRDSINTKYQSSGLTANIVTDKFGSRLVVGSTNTGEFSDISLKGIPELTVSGKTLMSTTPDENSAGTIGALAQDAKFTVDGLAMTSRSNTVDKAISGLSLTLNGTGPSTVTVATNNDGLKASIQKFVDAYNAVVNAITSLTTPGVDSDGNPKSAALTGDSLPRSILGQMRGPLSEVGTGDKLTVLSQLGITTNQKTGALDFNGTKFTAAMNDKKLGGEVQALFSGDNGLLNRMSKAITPYTETGGILETRTTNLNKTKARLATEQAALDRRIDTLTAVLTKKYNDMDSLVGKLKATASNITSMFEAMTAQQRNS
ncbi:Flagellar hook-associated protein 2 [compost metagenome]